MLIWKIAWRNLWRHKGKSLVIGAILFLGALLMTVGDALVTGAKLGLEENMVQRFTGHLILAPGKEKQTNIFFTNRALKVLSDYPQIKQVLQQQDEVESFLPMARGLAMLLHGGQSEDAGMYAVFGMNFEDYQQMFRQNVSAQEGELLKNGERGLLIGDQTRKLMYDFLNIWPVPEGAPLVEANLPPEALEHRETLDIRRELVFMGVGTEDLGADVRLPVKGIIRFATLNKVWSGLIFMDIESYRECFGYFTASDTAVALSVSQQTALSAESEDDLFAADDVVAEITVNTAQYDLAAMQQQTERAAVPVSLDEGAFNLVAVKLKPGIAIEAGQEQLRQAFAAAGIDVKIVTWQQAAGEVAQFATMTQGALYVFVLFIFFVAVIIIMNTLSMAAIERASEIGMMRAIGARKGFIRRMFVAETALLSMIFGGIGIIVGIVVAWGIDALRITTTTNEMLNLLFASDTVHPVIDNMGIVTGIVQLAIVTGLAIIYPIRVATKITPMEAITRD